ncbi:MAG: enolase C-terminal domain-like protein [Candidatus Paceibacterota bacterium]|jgi:enolase
MINKIEKIFAEEMKDSRGNSTIKVTMFSSGIFDSFSVPSGASTGVHEAYVLETDKAIENVNTIIASALVGQDIENQKEIDEILIQLDGTKNKNRLGGNAIIGVSIACAKTAAKVKGIEVYEYLRSLEDIKSSRKVPFLYMNLVNGGKHAKNNLAFQEYHIVPITDDIGEVVEIGIKIQNSIREIILEKYGEESLVLGDEGGYAPKIIDIREPLLILNEAIGKNNLQNKVRLALDVAASSFYEDGIYKIENKNVTKEELMDIYKELISEFNLLSIEDPFDEEDFESFAQLKTQNPNLKVVGDDLTVTNVGRVKEAIQKGSINAMIIKPNQIGTLSETLETMKLARENNIELIVSHRSGETDDDFIADLVYAFGCYGLKSGAPQKPERRIKYDRLKKISTETIN